MFKRLLVANRGEIALRIIKASKELEIETVAIYAEADKTSPHLDAADFKVCIGPAQSGESYLNMDAILETAHSYSCQAIHPGFGFLAENAIFAEKCRQQKVTFVGPRASSILSMGDKATARKTMKLAGLEPIPGSEGVLNTVQEAREFAEHINYPVLLKASAGGGGKGMRLVEEEACLEAAFIEASMEAEKAFGNPALYMEKFITGGRHIEFQVLVDHFGNAVHLGERECSVQRHHQKLVEESPSQAISSETRQSLGEKVARVAAKIGYYNAGTVEFLMTPQGELYFMEMNTRLQVEHPVTEMVTGVDIVQEQIRIAANQPLALRQEDICFQGSAIEVRINAEDPFEDFRPSPGTVEIFKVPEKEGSIRLDTHVEEGYTIPPYYDSMICKLIAHAKTRPEAIELMLKTLDSFEIGGVKTTIPIHKKILDSDLFRGGEYNTTILDHI